MILGRIEDVIGLDSPGWHGEILPKAAPSLIVVCSFCCGQNTAPWPAAAEMEQHAYISLHCRSMQTPKKKNEGWGLRIWIS